MPSFDDEFMEARLDLFYDLLEFQATRSLIEVDLCNIEVTDGHYIEIRAKEGAILMVEVPLSTTEQTAKYKSRR